MRCESCGEQMDATSRFCPRCGHDRGSAKASSTEACAQCGTTHTPGTRFCSRCGATLAPTVPPPAHCSRCGEVMDAMSRFCPRCGHDVVSDRGAGAVAP